VTRELRVEVVRSVYHLTQHATGDEMLFVDLFDRFLFDGLLGITVKRYDWDLHAYCQVGNHYHLLVQLRKLTLALGMQFLNGRYVQAFNQRHGRRGTLVRGRYTSTVVETEAHYQSCVAYIAMNPVGAGLCRRPEEWEWGSFAGRGTLARRPDEILRQFVDVALA
jgi:REP element-mobilizing transposase RayT